MASVAGGSTVYQTINGPKTVDQMYNELLAAGWGGPAGGSAALGAGSISNAYAQTAGGNVTLGGPTNITTNNNTNTNPNPSTPSGFTPQQVQQMAAAFNNAGQLTANDLAEKKREFDVGLQQQMFMWQQQGLPQLVIQQRAQALQEQQFLYQMQQAQQNVALQSLQFQAGLGGPSNWVQSYNYAQGLKNTDVPVFIQRLLNGSPSNIVGGAGLSAPQSISSLAGLAGVNAGVPAANINPAVNGPAPTGGVPQAADAQTTQLAPNVTMTQGAAAAQLSSAVPSYMQMAAAPAMANAGGYNWNKFGVSGPAPGATVGAIAPGSSGTSHAGTLIPGTTSMMAGGAQDLGYGPGQGGVQLSGTGGTNVTGYDPATGQLNFQYQFLTDKQRAVFGLYDNTTGQFVADPSNAQLGATPGNGGVAKAGDWMSYPYYSGSSGTGTLKVGQPIDPSHSYSIRVAFPLEGGGAGPNIETPFSGSTVLGMANSQAQPQAAAAPAQAPAPAAPAAPAAAYPTVDPNVQQAIQMGQQLFSAGGGALGPQALESIGPTGRSMLSSLGSAVGADVTGFMDQYQRSRIGQQAAQAG